MVTKKKTVEIYEVEPEVRPPVRAVVLRSALDLGPPLGDAFDRYYIAVENRGREVHVYYGDPKGYTPGGNGGQFSVSTNDLAAFINGLIRLRDSL